MMTVLLSAGRAAPWIIRANSRAGDFNDVDRARLVIARALVAVQYGEADEVERALSDYLGPKDLPSDEVAQYGPTLLARTRLWLGDLKGAREICEQTLDPLAAPSLQQVAMTGALSWIACVEGLRVHLEATLKVVQIHAFGPSISEFLFHAAARKLQPRLVEEGAELVDAGHPDENRRGIRNDPET